MGNSNLIINPKPPKGTDDYHTFSVRMKKELVKQLDDICVQSGYSRNKLISIFLAYAIEHCEIEKSQ